MDVAIRKDVMLHAYLLAQSGLPIVYSGDEVGQVNDYTYKDDPEKAEDSRYIHRGRFDWALVDRIEEPGSVQQRLYDALQRLGGHPSRGGGLDADAEMSVVGYSDPAVPLDQAARGREDPARGLQLQRRGPHALDAGARRVHRPRGRRARRVRDLRARGLGLQVVAALGLRQPAQEAREGDGGHARRGARGVLGGVGGVIKDLKVVLARRRQPRRWRQERRAPPRPRGRRRPRARPRLGRARTSS